MDVNLLGTRTGDGAIQALAGKPGLRRFRSGRGVTDSGLATLHEFPIFKIWQGGEIRCGLMSAVAEPNYVAGLPRLREISLAGLPGVTRQAMAAFPAQVRVKYAA